MDPRLKRLGAEIARAQDSGPDALDLDAQRARFLLHALSSGGRARAHTVAALALVAAAACLVALLWPAQLTFEVQGRRGQAGDFVAAPRAAALPVSFSDGSQLTLSAGGRARIAESTAQGARVVLERGALSVRVVHRASARWRIDAGPFRVRVIGTRFRVGWEGERFTLTLHEGAVHVDGPTLRGGRTVGAGEQLAISLAGEPARPAPLAARAAEPARPQPEASFAPVASRRTPATRAVAAPTPTPIPEPPRWRALARDGEYARAWALVAAAGFDAVEAGADGDALLLLADVARFTHHAREAAHALSTLRTRFPGHARAADAAFLLGRLAFDQERAPAEAARWFGIYLAERPAGAFAREAVGRSIECHQQLGELSAARRAAERYLAAHPNGPHRALARALLDGAEAHE